MSTLPERESMDYDVVIVGGGPAGLSAAIKLKQLAAAKNQEISVCVVEKGGEIGAHILSGNVFNPRALKELFPNFLEMGALGEDPTLATHDEFRYLLSSTKSLAVPSLFIPPPMHNEGNYIISLSQLVRWLGVQAEELGVEIYPGFPAAEVLYDESGKSVVGIATRDAGIDKTGKPKGEGGFVRGMELRAKQTLFAEGCRGSCSEEIMDKFNLRPQSGVRQNYGLGVKEVWEIPQEKHRAGFIQHTAGWPMDVATYGGSFLYHMKPNLVLVGFVVGLSYENPYLSPYQEFQRFKHHPMVSKHLEGGTCVQYGARTLNEGGYQALPKLTFNGGMLLGCSAGFLNVAAVKGSHTAIKSGIEAAEAVFAAKPQGEEELPSGLELTDYQRRMDTNWVHDELYSTRNFAAGFKMGGGLISGTLVGGITSLFTRGKEPFTLAGSKKRDCDYTKPASQCQPIDYPKPDGVLSFDLLTNLQRSGTNHEEDQEAHLRVKPERRDMAEGKSLEEFAGPEQRFCPAKVYEYHEGKLVINAQNCVHCKACSIKTPNEFIKWTVPEGGGGPAYTQT